MNFLIKATRSTQAIFLVCGLGMSAWAPMVPYAKERLQLNDSGLGLLLLLLGGGAITMMPLSGVLAHRYGSRIVILIAAFVLAFTLPLLVVLDSPVSMGITLFFFGAGIGTIDVAMNIHGVHVQNMRGKPIMSSLHGLFSVGGLLGSLGLGFLIKLGLQPLPAAITVSILLVLIVSINYSNLFTYEIEKEAAEKYSQPDLTGKSGNGSWFNRQVLFLGFMCFIVFLSEGAMLDWSALFLTENRQTDEAFAGVGYAAFSVAMATMRLLGDRLISKFNERTVVVGGSFIAAIGLLLAVLTPWLWTAIIGFVLLGLGAANIVPVFFSQGGRLNNVPAKVAIPAMTTIGYTGQLAGPALLGFIAHQYSLPVALGCCSLLLMVVMIAFMTRKGVISAS